MGGYKRRLGGDLQIYSIKNFEVNKNIFTFVPRIDCGVLMRDKA